MRSSGGSRNRFTKRQERNAIGAQEAQQGLPLRSIRMKGDVHRVAMIKVPAIVNSALAKNSNWQRPLKRVREKPLDLPGIRQDRACRKGVHPDALWRELDPSHPAPEFAAVLTAMADDFASRSG